VRYGLFDLDWLLRSIRFSPIDARGSAPRLAIDGMKGLPAIEGFFLARRFMFEQVYLHKATRAAEVLIKAIFARAARVLEDGTKLPFVPEAIRLASRGQPVPLGAYLELDDVVVGAAFASWESCADPVLADLCRRLRARRLGKTIAIYGEADEAAAIDRVVAAARERTLAAGLDPDLHVQVDVAEDGGALGDEAAGALEVVFGDGRARPLLEVSPMLRSLRSAPIRRVRVVVPPEIRGDLVTALDGRAAGS
jgi:HD superfamily phosphohydrolase